MTRAFQPVNVRLETRIAHQPLSVFKILMVSENALILVSVLLVVLIHVAVPWITGLSVNARRALPEIQVTGREGALERRNAAQNLKTVTQDKSVRMAFVRFLAQLKSSVRLWNAVTRKDAKIFVTMMRTA